MEQEAKEVLQPEKKRPHESRKRARGPSSPEQTFGGQRGGDLLQDSTSDSLGERERPQATHVRVTPCLEAEIPSLVSGHVGWRQLP